MNSNSIGAVLFQAEQQLKQSSDASRLDSERILLHALRKRMTQPSHKATAGEASWLYAHSDEQLTQLEQEEFEKLVAERKTGKPLAYILGEWEFYGRKFLVTPDVLVPRPETEDLIREALKHIEPGMTVVDLGTGSGIIAVTLARELATPSRRTRDGVVILATDISPAALEVATKNAQRHGVLERIEFIQEDISQTLRRKIDLIVSNPPYLSASELESHFAPLAGGASRDKSATKGLTFEPRIALDGGPDGQDFVRKIAESKIPAVVETTGGKIQTFNL